jgi:hypothetical protein
MPLNYKKTLGYTLLGTGVAVLVTQPFALADDPTAEPIEVPGFSFSGAATATGTASLSNSSAMSVTVPDTVLDQEYEGRFERFGGIKIIRTRFDRG